MRFQAPYKIPAPDIVKDIDQNCRIISVEFTNFHKENLFHPVIWIDVEKINFTKGIQNVVQVFGNEDKQNIEQSDAGKEGDRRREEASVGCLLIFLDRKEESLVQISVPEVYRTGFL